jgi:Tfp pilus assembly protein PilF
VTDWRAPVVLALAVPAAAQAPASSPAAVEQRDQLLARAAAELEAGRPREAERILRSSADQFQSVKALLRLANLQSRQGDAAGAARSLERALELAPNAEPVLSAYAQLSLAGKAPVAAIVALEPLTRMCPTVGQYHYLLGVAFMQAGDMPSAVESLERARGIEPDRPLTLIALGLALNGRKLFAEAKPHLLRSLELEPHNVEALAALAESEEGLGELGPAELHARRALARQDGNATANLVMGMLFMKRDNPAEAKDALARALAQDPELPKAHYQLSLALARLGDAAGSQRHLELYRKASKEMEERLRRLRDKTGLSEGGMRP